MKKRVLGCLLSLILILIQGVPADAADRAPSIFDQSPDTPANDIPSIFDNMVDGADNDVPSIFHNNPDTNSGTAGATPSLSISESAARLEEKYDIHILGEWGTGSDATIDQSTLNVLDTALGYITPTIVRQVSAYYQEKLGQKLTFSFEHPRYQSQNGIELVGMFEVNVATIHLYVPSSSEGTFSTGASPLTVVHEFAHALHIMCGDVLGAETIEREWRALNHGISYNRNVFSAYDAHTFVSNYGATDYSEDLAEVFAHAFTRVNSGQGLSENLVVGGAYTSLGNKVLYLEGLLQRVFTDAQQAVENLHKAFSVPAALEYQGLRVAGGEDMQFIGFSAPKNIRSSIVTAYGITERSSQWIRELGGWQVAAGDGFYYLVFPGGSVIRLSHQLVAAA